MKEVPDTTFFSQQRYLAIETSSPRLSLAIGDGKRVLATYVGQLDWRHAETLFDGIEKLLRRARWRIQSLTGVAVSIGPGSFTGIRIGLAAARVLGQTLRIPVAGISSLETLAAGAKTRRPWLAPQIDALRGQVFSALYERTSPGSQRRILAEGMAPADVWMKKIEHHIRNQPPATRRGGRAPEVWRSVWISPLKGCYPDAGVLLTLAIPKLALQGPESYKSVLPLYIRQAAAKERRR